MDIKREKQEHNHRIMNRCTALEQQVLEAIADLDFDRANGLFAEITELQKEYL